MSHGFSIGWRPLAALLALLLGGCALQTYEPAPLVAEKVIANLTARNVADDNLRAFMKRHGYATAQWPLPHWDLKALTLMAIYYHTDMDVARARLDLQRAAEVTAAQRPNPSISPGGAYHSNTAGTVSNTPWSIGFALDIPILPADRRQARIDRARALSEAARLAIGEAAWQVRSRLRKRFVDALEAQQTAALLKRVLETRSREAALLERRQAVGEAGASEVTIARLRLQEARLALDTTRGKIDVSRAALAEALGIAYARTRDLDIAFPDLATDAPRLLPAAAVQRAALRNRLDIRQAEARYAGAEAKLREEIARQYPQFRLSPGFLWDQGDLVTALGTTILLPILNLNEGPIAEARAQRQLEAARFDGLQARVLGDLSRTTARHAAAVRVFETTKKLVETQRARLTRARALFAHGETDRLTVVGAEIEMLAAEQARLRARIDALRALGAVEDAVQRPLDGSDPLPPDTAEPPPGQRHSDRAATAAAT